MDNMSSPENIRAIGARLSYAGVAASRLQQERVRRNWTQEHVGRLLAGALLRPTPYTRGYVHRIETLEYDPPGAIKIGLGIVFGVSVDTIQSLLSLPDQQAAAA